MKFSVIIPSLLEEYKNCASDRVNKLKYALNSVLDQTFQDFEIILVSDGCQQTIDIYHEYDSDKIRCFYSDRMTVFSGGIRQAGINEAKGDYIIYLDGDDYYGVDHLKFVAEGLKDYDWVYFNEITKTPEKEDIKHVEVKEGQGQGIAGTSSMCHKRSLPVSWENCDGYRHDWTFIEKLLEHKNNSHIGNSQYYICHMAKMYDTPIHLR